jgi:3-methyladenine DNA glycosylase/8-oxoguanine DNA glycosylase
MVRLTRRCTFILRPKAPYSFELTVRKPAGWNLFTPSEIYEGGALSTALHIDGRLVGLKLVSGGDTDSPRILATAVLEREPEPSLKRNLRRSLEDMLGTNEDLGGFYAMARRDSILRHTIDDLRGMHDTHPSDVFGSAILAVCLQMAPIKRSEAMMACIMARYGEEAEFEGERVRAWPLPGTISRLMPEELARVCRLGYRARRIVELANALLDGGFPTMEELARLPPEEAKEKLMELPGIGNYSADIVSPKAGFPIDVWSADVFGKLFYGKEPEDARAAVETIKAEGIRRWGKWSWMAFFYIAQDLENLSRKLGVQLRLQ